MENTQGFFISVLAVSDITSILLRTTLVILQYANMTDKYSVLCKARSFIFGLPSGISSFLHVAIALDRYLRICKNNSMFSKWRGRVIIVVMSVAFIGVLPKLFIADIVQKNSSDNHTSLVCKISDEDKIIYCLPVLVLCIGIAAVLVILYGRIISTLNAHFKRIENSLTTAEISGNLEIRDEQNEQKSELSQRNILVMKKTISIFIAISVTFFLSYIPFLITYMLRKSRDEISFVISLLLYNISSMVNPFIYAFMDAKFRSETKNLMTQTFLKCGFPEGTEL
ncbi:unnamed protein product [Mytilus edulis]|uniref:G-protein coupled receptors family 1 profile domain-containing protein n=1 Tax=Mytilus edulis TaxID=6550 RepID=A0A8S3S057_MYTED|nr:unnamed protein product [Mytilus edulis]